MRGRNSTFTVWRRSGGSFAPDGLATFLGGRLSVGAGQAGDGGRCNLAIAAEAAPTQSGSHTKRLTHEASPHRAPSRRAAPRRAAPRRAAPNPVPGTVPARHSAL